MQKNIKLSVIVCAGILSFGLALTAFQTVPDAMNNGNFKLPFKKAGLTEKAAAAHLLSRFTYGATPEDIDATVKMGLENWFLQQLDGKIGDTALIRRLAEYDALSMSNQEVIRHFPKGGKVEREAFKLGVVTRDSAEFANKAAYKEKLRLFMLEHGYRPEQELMRQFVSQKLLRAAYSKNQLHEVLTDFWFNHFNVSATNTNCSQFIPAYERDVIRPNTTGKFADLLLATAQSPAMLYYLDNFNSTSNNDAPEKRLKKLREKAEAGMASSADFAQLQRLSKKGINRKGLNENYAREIMELHTLGVDGGYTQQDVTQAAKVLTGWTVFPMEENALTGEIKRRFDSAGKKALDERGFVHNGDFLFMLNRHDQSEKKVLDKVFPAGGGYEEGTALIQLLAHHASTAKFICGKLARRFVSDEPPATLVEKMVATFKQSDGSISEVLKTMVTAPEFWQPAVIRAKTKSPFELAISAVRTLKAEITAPIMLNQWIMRMGQRIYYYQAPTGFPDQATYWINTGSLLNRMNFGLAFAAQKVPGTTIDLAALNQHHEPESAAAALLTYCRLILPERDLQNTIKRLTPLINDPQIEQKLSAASGNTVAATKSSQDMMDEPMMTPADNSVSIREEKKLARTMMRKDIKGADQPIIYSPGNNTVLAQVVGIILGSPEFQRR